MDEKVQHCVATYDMLNERKSPFSTWRIRDAWQIAIAYEACLLLQTALKSSGAEIPNNLIGVISWLKASFLNRSVYYWRGLSGSDDFAWAGMLNCLCYKEFFGQEGVNKFLNSKNFWSGSRGAVNLYNEIRSHYVDDDGSVWWDYKKTYKAAISNATYALLGIYLYRATANKDYMKSVKATVNWLLNESKLYNPESGLFGIRDGVKKDGTIDNTFWTYNQGPIIKVLSDVYKMTHYKSFLETATKIVDFVIENLVDKSSGILCEMSGSKPRQVLSTDAMSFKGIFMRYLTEFVLENKAELTQEKIAAYKSFVHKNAESVWEYSYNPDNRSFSPYWHLKSSVMNANETPSLVAALSLFVASLRLAH